MSTKFLRLSNIVLICLALLSLVSLFFFTPIHFHDSLWLAISLLSWIILLIICLLLNFRFPTTGLLTSGLCTVAILRISGIYDFYSILIPTIIILIILFINFLFEIRNKMSMWESSMTFIRIYIGYDIMAHAAEKLFAGPAPYLQDVQAFINMNAIMPYELVVLAGLCEFGAAIALGLGFLTRLGALCTALYLTIATVTGNHFSLGFIWADPGGGWEYPVMWTVLVLVFAVTGAGKFSFDYYINERLQKQWYRKLAGQ
jgi:putative oxidoreductase